MLERLPLTRLAFPNINKNIYYLPVTYAVFDLVDMGSIQGCVHTHMQLWVRCEIWSVFRISQEQLENGLVCLKRSDYRCCCFMSAHQRLT